MRVLHCGAMLKPPPGIIDQMAWEQEAADNLGIDWDVRLFCPPGSATPSKTIVHSSRSRLFQHASLGKVGAWFKLRREYHSWLEDRQSQYDILILRYYVHDPFQYAFAKSSEKPVWLVHHTRELPELALDGALGYVRAGLDAVLAPPTLRAIAGIIGVTNEIVAYEKRRAGADLNSTVYPNGICFADDVVDDRRGSVPEILFMASGFAPWHGLDLLLASMRNNRDDFVLHLVGQVFEEDLKNASRDSRVKIHGLLTRNEIRQVAATCSLGLSSFGLHRKGMREACTLKVRQYLMMGLPVYAGHRDVFPDDFPYYRNSEVDIAAVLSYARAQAIVEREHVSHAARPFIDKQILLSRLRDSLRQISLDGRV